MTTMRTLITVRMGSDGFGKRDDAKNSLNGPVNQAGYDQVDDKTYQGANHGAFLR